MLISFDPKFIVLAPTKTASTAVGAYISPLANVSIGQPELGKHDDLESAISRHRWVFSVHDWRQFKIALLVRDPIERLASLFNSHQQPAFKGTTSYTGDLGIAEFVRSWIPMETWQTTPQVFHPWVASDGFVADFIIRSYNIEEDVAAFLTALSLPPMNYPPGRHNVSPEDQDIELHRAQLAKIIGECYYPDRLILQQYSGRILNEHEKCEITRITSVYYMARQSYLVTAREASLRLMQDICSRSPII